MNSELTTYLELRCEKEDINDLINISNEGLPIALASSIQTSDQTLISGMCIALKCIGRKLVSETTKSDLTRILVNFSNGILAASCKNAAVLNELDISSI